MEEIIEHLRCVPFFSGLNDEDLKRIFELAIIRKYRKNMIIFMEGEPGEALYFIRQGKVKIYKTTADGREQILHILQDGDIFAEVVLFDSGPYPASAEVMEDAQIGLIRNNDVEELVKSCPDLALKILRVMSKRLRTAQGHIRDLALKDTISRVASMLVKLAQEHGQKNEKGILINLSLSRQELANYVGTTRETVTRILSDFKKSKVIEIDKQSIMIINLPKLESWV